MSAATLALEALENIALAGMSPSPEMSDEAVTEWHARQAWNFIGIAARALEPLRTAAALEAVQVEPVAIESKRIESKRAKGWRSEIGVVPVPILYSDEINDEQVQRDDIWLATTNQLRLPLGVTPQAAVRVEPVAYCSSLTGARPYAAFAEEPEPAQRQAKQIGGVVMPLFATPQQAAPTAEPVAWTWDTAQHDTTCVMAYFGFTKPASDARILNLTPLYATPQHAAAPELLQELINIANADTAEWDDRTEFEVWAKSRARAAIAKATVGAA